MRLTKQQYKPVKEAAPVRFGDYTPDVAKPDLGGAILKLRGEIESFIDGKVVDQPAESLRQMLTHGSGCLCAVALNILAERGDV